MKILAPLSWFLVPSLKRVGFPGGSRNVEVLHPLINGDLFTFPKPIPCGS